MTKTDILSIIILCPISCALLYFLVGVEAVAWFLLMTLISIIVVGIYNNKINSNSNYWNNGIKINSNSNYCNNDIKIPSHKMVIDQSFDLLHNKFIDRQYIYKTGFAVSQDMERRINSGIYSENDIEQKQGISTINTDVAICVLHP